MDLTVGTCCGCPVSPSLTVGLILASLAMIAIGRFLSVRLGRWGQVLGLIIAGSGVALTLLGSLTVLRVGVGSLPASFQMEVVPQTQMLFGVLRGLIPILWIASAIAVWTYAGRPKP